MTTGIEQLRALVAAGEKLPTIQFECLNVDPSFRRCVVDEDENAILQEPTVSARRIADEVRSALVFSKNALNSRASVAAALEVCLAAAEYRKADHELDVWCAENPGATITQFFAMPVNEARAALDAALEALTKSRDGAGETLESDDTSR